MAVAMNTYMSFLMHSTNGTSYTSLCPIKDYPDFLNDVNTIDVTSLQNANHVYIQGLLDAGADMTFTANYRAIDYATIKALANTEQYLAIWFGGTAAGGTVTPDGSDGKWQFKGYISVGIVGKGVDEAREMQIHVTPTTDITFSFTNSN